ncbi:hypothetical protein KSP40_PGU000150 [Platanthera guangdongensis]|uniref:Geranylgeranyl diphosphate synthase n=1 Tax=Platanthera guangdongensis TaxID=2320717 RepID=A0ABR2M6X5_9ASPA
MATCDLGGGDRSTSFPTACALEMIHSASLIHDDLPCMDAAPLRRAYPSNHTVFGIGLALLAGDALFPRAFRHIVGHTPNSPSRWRLSSARDDCAGEVVRKTGRVLCGMRWTAGRRQQGGDRGSKKEKRVIWSNRQSGKMRSNYSMMMALGMERATEIVGELKEKAKNEINIFGDRYGDGVLQLYSFVDYAVERGFVIESIRKAAAAATVTTTENCNSGSS